MRFDLRAAALVLATLVACSSGSSDGGGGGEGAACTSGSACASDLFCFVTGPDPSGTCTRPPAACGAAVNCTASGPCRDEIAKPCASGLRCQGSGKAITAACSLPASRKEGESCSPVVGCMTGLFCFVSASGQAGVCEKLPVACGTDPGCSANNCFAEVRQRCTVQSCAVIGTEATIQCK